jgi:hypothetical protein
MFLELARLAVRLVPTPAAANDRFFPRRRPGYGLACKVLFNVHTWAFHAFFSLFSKFSTLSTHNERPD